MLHSTSVWWRGPLGALLSDVVQHIAHYPIRTRGTFCGSIAHADRASEWCLAAVTLGATVTARSIRGIRTLDAEDLFEGFMTTSLAEDELLSEVRLPLLPLDTRFGFYEFSRRAGDYAIAMSLVTFRLVDGAMADIRVGIGGAEGKPRRCAEAEAALSGKVMSGAGLRGSGGGGGCGRRSDGRCADKCEVPARSRAHRDTPRAGAGCCMKAVTIARFA